MKTISKLGKMTAQTDRWRAKGLTVGLVPTLGFLHRGHESLLRRAKKNNDRVVLSIYLNPNQFRKMKFQAYPKDLNRDLEIAKKLGVDAVFTPSIKSMSPSFSSTHVEVPDLAKKMDGKKMLWHFRAVTTVVMKLFSVVKPDKAYFGKKDVQQLMLIQKMVKDLSLGIRIIPVSTVRDKDRLPFSSRNFLLSSKEREAARMIPLSMKRLSDAVQRKGIRSVKRLKKIIRDLIGKEPLAKIDSLEIVSAKTLDPVDPLRGTILIHLAVFIGTTRLTDNRTLRIQA